jgi:hypothetical protein
MKGRSILPYASILNYKYITNASYDSQGWIARTGYAWNCREDEGWIDEEEP